MTVDFCFSFGSTSKFGLKDVAGAAADSYRIVSYRIEGAGSSRSTGKEQEEQDRSTMSERRSHIQMAPPPPPPKPNKSQTANGNGNGNGNANGVLANGNKNYGKIVAGQDQEPLAQKSSGVQRSQSPPRTEQVVMTPRGKTANSTVILIERKLVGEINDRVHVAGGDHTGIIINKDTVAGQKSASKAAALSLEFRVFLVSANTGKHSQESRTLRFWFRDWLTNDEKQAHIAQDFFKELVSPQDFPRDYVGFIKKIMKLLQHGYSEIQSIEIELRILEETSAPPSRPPRDGYIIYCYGDCNRKFEEALMAQRKTGDGDNLMKAIWLDMYTDQLSARRK
ncbi:hypothetical protein M5D96_011085 [Drosophila gunungcola]|uniref:Uncharacterized protein n=1 Tax=Drosophila gunungcola TaxID=103775 RepID=A0A9P9YGE5_9MUSC|nr:hypothetical protein M5D96_011085 [Drosophila gunungcola]